MVEYDNNLRTIGQVTTMGKMSKCFHCGEATSKKTGLTVFYNESCEEKIYCPTCIGKLERICVYGSTTIGMDFVERKKK